MIEGAMKAGGAGVSMGRNAFQHKNPTKLVKAACAIVHDGISAEDALKIVELNRISFSTFSGTPGGIRT